MRQLQSLLKKHPVIYVTRDLERGLGLPLSTPGYFIITNHSTFGKEMARHHSNILLVKGQGLLDTNQLLGNARVKKFMASFKNPVILVFKSTAQIERTCVSHEWKLLNPSANLANTIEEKITQLNWLGPLRRLLPSHKKIICKNLRLKSKPFIAQFNRAHSGAGTMLVKNEQQIQQLQKKYPERYVRVSDYIVGPVFTCNGVVWGNHVLVGNVSYQITGLPPFTDQPFATVGNDWQIPHRLLTSKQRAVISSIATTIGKKLFKDNWRGLFGVDIIMDQVSGKLYLLEINARQPASTTYESQLQEVKDEKPKTNNDGRLTIFEAHLASLLNIKFEGQKLIVIDDGAQVVQRVIEPKNNYNLLTINNNHLFTINKKLKSLGLSVIPYDNTKPGADLIRIQSSKGIIREQNIFNELGDIIAKTIIC